MGFESKKLDPVAAEDAKANARVRALFALRKAFKHRGIQAKDLAVALGRDKGYVSRVLSGRSRAMTLETLAVFLEALGFHLPLEPVPMEQLKKANYDARPIEQPVVGPRRASVTEALVSHGQREVPSVLSGMARPAASLNAPQLYQGFPPSYIELVDGRQGASRIAQ